MGHFSFLALDTHQKSRVVGAKPASHGTYEAVSDEYTTLGRLSTAGSLYSLYNEHSPTHPLGQLENRRGNAKYVTLPRRKEPSAPVIEPDPAWFGGRGSVRDLAKEFQEQIQMHNYYQAVLDGTVNKERSSEKICGERDYGNHANVCVDSIKAQSSNTDNGSMETVSDITANENGKKNIHQIAFDVDDDNSSVKSSNSSSTFTTGASTDSQAVSNWVDHELRKIKRKISKEIMSQHSLAKVQSPDLFENSESPMYSQSRKDAQKEFGDGYRYNSSSDYTEVTPISSVTSISFTDQEAGDHVKCDQEEEFYYDDELYLSPTHVSRMQEKKSPWSAYQKKVNSSPTYPPICQKLRNDSIEEKRNELKSRLVKSNLPMRTMLKETESPSKKVKNIILSKPDENKKRLSKIPTSRSKLAPKSSEGAFSNIMTVRSSLEEAGRHQVTHQVKNLKTGGSNTMLNKLVNGQKINLTFKAVS